MDLRSFIRKVLSEVSLSKESGPYDTVAFPIVKRRFNTFSCGTNISDITEAEKEDDVVATNINMDLE